MRSYKPYLPVVIFMALVLSASLVWAIGFQLSETKAQLQLKYDLAVVDHGTGRVSVTLTLLDEGRLKPLRNVDLVIPNSDGSGTVDLSLPIAPRLEDGKQIYHIHLKKEWAERASFNLVTDHIDGKKLGLTYYFYVIPLADEIKNTPAKSK